MMFLHLTVQNDTMERAGKTDWGSADRATWDWGDIRSS